MTGDQVLKIFKQSGGFITDSHIILTSGKHSSSYLNKDAIYPHTGKISQLCLVIAKKFKNKNIEAVVGPSLGGIILSQWTAHHLSELENREILAVYTDKTSDNNQVFKRGYDRLVKGKRILLVEDVTSTGGSVAKVIRSVKGAGGQIYAVCVLVNRNPDEVNSKTFGIPFAALAEIKVTAWNEKDCPLCRKNVPVNTNVGKGSGYLAGNKAKSIDTL
ncbi:hypothetical protein A3I80_03615 [Candidatus Gottesmanbacteria bacterium RIFCSPLOWO2_02_FULL_40_10]|uniref:Orotate phosphoribosyltransferase n=1 Tax=Candidatus Gottesmanbacteria bacterium RIFCSPHIGHO2_01_FULL_40_15 TaxID=1798376 RepID=A0A1F5Z1P0_9BACT|nr:MAG: hypothetical protein A2777_04675 [Candidatus Gottesmanbacteria bacterium RIFCSPHIGHO2_01_FULL_40_15]OGG31811.1 MAG: hypothetical protein A3I80_03615 [Candidatus Gottesmanbacteria bacterium RIFCSPLOWO2_02_FULL_40_10]